MLIRAGFEISVQIDAKVPMLCALSPRPDIITPVLGDGAVHTPSGALIDSYIDSFGNKVTRVDAPAGMMTLVSDFVVRDLGNPDVVVPDARQHPIAELPDDVLRFLVASRFCESDLLSGEAWSRFGHIEGGWARAQAICDFVHGHITFGYGYGRPTKSALDAFREGNGVCRDFAHLSIALCRAMNIPARYASGYLGDIGIAPLPDPMDFCAWFEVYLGDRWYTFDARYNTPRIGRVLMVRGLDAADVSMITTYGRHRLRKFEVWCAELPATQKLSEINLRTPATLEEPSSAAA
ncbi:transglutaminase family protein [Amaricoccus sp.]|uniref:transglutaminase family protein n=1 Tax=Amaricoccus sp. TaxID=1872485 RepID=UPI002638754A|nr:transglutaminase family protein [uncultured Amaricoccus sp.]